MRPQPYLTPAELRSLISCIEVERFNFTRLDTAFLMGMYPSRKAMVN